MINEDYVSFEVSKLLKEKWFNWDCKTKKFYPEPDYDQESPNGVSAPTLQTAMKWLRETHNVLVIPDYDYECTDKSYCYKIYKLGENGKPERVPIEGVRYDMRGGSHVDIVAHRDYKRSFFDYETYEEACEDGIRYCLENLI